MTTATRGRLVYATWGYTTHDRRFVQVGVDAGWTVSYFRFDGGERDLCQQPLPANSQFVEWIGSRVSLSGDNRTAFVEDFRVLAERIEAGMVHAGPLPTVSAVVAEAVDIPIIVMSWASDLLIDVEESAALAQAARFALSRAVAVIVDCEEVGRRAVALGAGEDQLVTLPWGIDLRAFPYAPTSELVDRPLRLLCLRSFETIYDIDILIRAVGYVVAERGGDALHLSLAGSGSLEGALKALASELGLDRQITWLGRIPESRVQWELAACDVHVSPARCDGTSISLLQALATGRPSIVTDIPCNRNWIRHGNAGWLTPAHDVEKLAVVIMKALDERQQIGLMSRNARAIAEGRADWSLNRQLVADLYERVASPRDAARPENRFQFLAVAHDEERS